MNIISVIQPSELGPHFKMIDGTWHVNFPTTSAPPPPISNDARNIIKDTNDGMFIDTRDRLAYALVQDNTDQKIRMYSFPQGTEFDVVTATLVNEIDMLAMNGQFDDIAIDEGVVTFTDAQTGLTLTLNTNELQKVGSIKSSNTITVTESGGILKLSAKIDPKANNLLEVKAGGLQVSPDKIADIANAQLANAKVHTQEMFTLGDTVIGHVVGDQITEIPKVRLQNTAGDLLGLANNPNSLVKSSRYYRELTFKMTGGEYGDDIYIGNIELWNPVTDTTDENTTLVVNWGDGSPTETFVGWDIYNAYHEYAAGQECIATFMFDRPIPMFNPQGSAIKEVISFGITPILNPRFEYCKELIQVPSSLPSYVTSLERMFEDTNNFNGDGLVTWDTSNVTNITRAFSGAKVFNQPIGNWNVSNVTMMEDVFGGSAFNQPLNNWDVTSVISMRRMFADTWSFDQPLDKWDMSNVQNLFGMFYNASAFNQPLNTWDVSAVTTMHGMFQQTSTFNQPLDQWDVSNVDKMTYMFYGAKAFNQSLRNWCVSKITFTPEGFGTNAVLEASNYPIWGTCPSGIKDSMQFTTMAGNLTYQGSAGDVIEVSDGSLRIIRNPNETSYSVPSGTHTVKLMGKRTTGTVKLAGAALSTVKTFPAIDSINKVTFAGSSNLIQVPTTLPKNLTDCSYMFHGCSGFNYDISGWDTSNVTNMTYMFSQATKFNQPIGSWNISNVTDISFMLHWAEAFNQNVNDWDVSNKTSLESLFHLNRVFNQPLDKWDVSKVTNLRNTFGSAHMFNQDISMWDVSNVTDFTSTFGGAHAFNKPLNSWNVSKGTNFYSTFAAAQAFNQPLDNWDVSSATNMWGMFNTAYAFNQPLNSWDVSNVTDMAYMFGTTNAFNQPLDQWDVSNVTSMTGMFSYAKAFTQNLSQWCVAFIANEPQEFGYRAPAFTYPVWGTCPRGENLV